MPLHWSLQDIMCFKHASGRLGSDPQSSLCSQLLLLEFTPASLWWITLIWIQSKRSKHEVTRQSWGSHKRPSGWELYLMEKSPSACWGPIVYWALQFNSIENDELCLIQITNAFRGSRKKTKKHLNIRWSSFVIYSKPQQNAVHLWPLNSADLQNILCNYNDWVVKWD